MPKHLMTGQGLTGQVGSAITLLDRVLCLGEAVYFDGVSVYTDRSAEARLEGGTAFTILGSTTDSFFVGYDSRFGRLRVNLAAPATSGTLVVEYWTGSAWAAVAGLVDGTNGLTVSGELTWTVPTAATWAKNQVNAGTSFYHIRVRASALVGTPTASYLIINWSIYDGAAGTNTKVYRSIGEDGLSNILAWVADNGVVDVRSIGVRFYETWDPVGHTGTNPCPTVPQAANGGTYQKSASTDGVVRPAEVVVSRDGFILCSWIQVTVVTGVAIASTMYVGKFTSYVSGDASRLVIGCNAISTIAGSMMDAPPSPYGAYSNWAQRAYTGSVGAVAVGFQTFAPAITTISNFPPYPNGADGSLLTSKVIIWEGTVGSSNIVYRGEYEGVLAVLHNRLGTLANQDIFTDPVSGLVYRLWCLLSNATYLAGWAAVAYDY